MTIAIILAAASSAATVPPNVVRFARPAHGTIEHMAIVARDRASHAHVTLTLELATTSADKQEIVVPLRVSRAVEITGLSIALNNRTATATVESPSDARASYRQMVDMVRDPALLEWARGDQLTLRAYPITKDSSATITLELELAHGATLTLDPGPLPLANVDVDLGVPETWATFDAPRTLALANAIAADAYEPANERPRVDRRHSLVALPELSGKAAHGGDVDPLAHYWLRDSFQLFEVAAAHHTALGHCFALGRELDPTISSRIDIAVRLAPNAAPQAGVGGIDIAAVNTCLVDEIASWPFPAVSRAMTLRAELNLANYEVVTTSPKP